MISLGVFGLEVLGDFVDNGVRDAASLGEGIGVADGDYLKLAVFAEEDRVARDA